MEKEDNDDLDRTAQRIGHPTVGDGLLAKREDDCFRFPGKKGQRIMGDILCAEIGSGMFTWGLGLESLDRQYFSRFERSARLPRDDDYVFRLSHNIERTVKNGRPVYRLTIGE